jgi:hypothetical protein
MYAMFFAKVTAVDHCMASLTKADAECTEPFQMSPTAVNVSMVLSSEMVGTAATHE